MRKKVLIVFGTRPEAIKMAPLAKELAKHPEIETGICVTAQHREMLDQAMAFFEIKPDFDLNLMRPEQNLYQLTADVIVGLKPALEEFKPDVTLVHGDTVTSAAAAWASFYAGSAVGHVEAGLRTYDKHAPFPEEVNRQITSRIADWHFAPTPGSKQNLVNEGIAENAIAVTGNTVIDALLWTRQKLTKYEDAEIARLKSITDASKKIILVTGHRRENFGDGFVNVCSAIRQIAESGKDVQIIYPVHPNPNVRRPVYSLLKGLSNVLLVEPLGYPAFVWLMAHSYLIVTDSGGVQEEAPSLGKPVLVMRETTERPEAVEAGTVKMVGTDSARITESVAQLLNSEPAYKQMSRSHNPYGDGNACAKIVSFLREQLFTAV